MTTEPILRVAVPAPVYSCFDYLPPPGVDAAALRAGMRLRVPFGRGERCGVLLGVESESPVSGARLKRAARVLDREPLLAQADLELLQWAARYYQHPIGEVIATALPVRLRKGEAQTSLHQNGWRLTVQGASVDLETLKRAPRQAGLLHLLQGQAQGLAQEYLDEHCGTCRPTLRLLEERGWVARCEIAPVEMAPDVHVAEVIAAPALNPDQQAAVAAVRAAGRQFEAFLLDGVTGSGKTEVYLTLVEQAVSEGRQVLMLVPEIALTPQLLRRFRRRIRSPLALLHSGMNDRERELAWLAAAQGRAAVVLGTRSAIFTPMPLLGLILVDEEHDLSFKQQEGFRYSARDLAVVRARQTGCPVVLGSATPSLESLCNAHSGRYHHLVLPERAGNAQPPRLDLLDVRSVRLDGGMSPTLVRLMEQELAAGNQVMLFLNRRGYAPVVSCHACGWLSECPRCDARMTLHQSTGLLWCHHCGHQRRLNRTCPTCGSDKLRPLGHGTERLEEALERRFPDVPIARIDRDTTRRKGALEKLLAGIRAGDYRLLLGTQMLAKGHHFPEVTLVGILDVDQGLFGADFRAAERMAQLIEQVAGRAGRAERTGRVLIQTRYPDHPLMQRLVREGYGAFARECLAERQQVSLPPYSHQALLRAEAPAAQAPTDFLEQALAAGRALAPAEVEFWGPVPAPMERRGGRIRAHLLVQALQRRQLQQLLSAWVPALAALPGARRVRWSIDVDPQEML